jgi:hypothetical protein
MVLLLYAMTVMAGGENGQREIYAGEIDAGVVWMEFFSGVPEGPRRDCRLRRRSSSLRDADKKAGSPDVFQVF